MRGSPILYDPLTASLALASIGAGAYGAKRTRDIAHDEKRSQTRQLDEVERKRRERERLAFESNAVRMQRENQKRRMYGAGVPNVRSGSPLGNPGGVYGKPTLLGQAGA